MQQRNPRQRPSLFAPMSGQVDRLNRLNEGRDPDVPRRARIKGKWKSKIIELEVWLQENLFQLERAPLSAAEKADAELLVYGAAGVLLAEQYPRLTPVVERYTHLLQRVHHTTNDSLLLGSGAADSLAQLSLKLEELKACIRDLDRSFDRKAKDLQQLANDIANKRLEVENLKILCRVDQEDSLDQ